MAVSDRPLGPAVSFTGAPAPAPDTVLGGEHVTLVPLDPAAHADALFAVSHPPAGDPGVWTYLFEDPAPDRAAFADRLEHKRAQAGDVYLCVLAEGRPRGQVAFLTVVPEHGSLELGDIWFAPELQRTPASTEAIFLLLRHAFDDLGYRRVEWKCNALNAPSRNAALRFGFTYEGTFRQHRVVKGHNRDTAWFAMIDGDWPALRAAFVAWLAPENFDAQGRQRRSLCSLRPHPERQL